LDKKLGYARLIFIRFGGYVIESRRRGVILTGGFCYMPPAWQSCGASGSSPDGGTTILQVLVSFLLPKRHVQAQAGLTFAQ
jgi:hypothetical protein